MAKVETRILLVIVFFALWVVTTSATNAQTPTPTPSATSTPTAGPDLPALLRQFYDTINQSDADGAAAMFTDDAVMVLSGCNRIAPCTSKAEIHRTLRNAAGEKLQLSVVDIRVSDHIVIARVEHRDLRIQGAGVERIIQTHTATFTGEKLSRLISEDDPTDLQTIVWANSSRISSVITAWNRALRSRNIAEVMAFFTDDAVFDGIGLCTVAPCMGKAAVQKEMERQMADNTAVDPVPGTARVSGNTRTGQLHIRADSIQAVGIERILVSLTAVVEGQNITLLREAPDPSDPQTATFLAAPRSPSRMPSTGSGGLVHGDGDKWATNGPVR